MTIRLIPNEIVKATRGRFAGGIGLTMIDGVCTDVQRVRPGCLFVPLDMSSSAELRSIEQALSRGAAGSLVSNGTALSGIRKKHGTRFLIQVDDTMAAFGDIALFWRQKFSLPVVVVTGGDEARQTGDMATKIFLGRHTVLTCPPGEKGLLALAGTLMDITADHRAALFVIDAADLQRAVQLCNPSIFLITGLASEDGKGAGSLMRKALRAGTVVIKSDAVPKKRPKGSKARIVTYGSSRDDVFATDVHYAANETVSLTLHMQGETMQVTTKLPAGAAVECVLGAAAAASCAGLDNAAIHDGLES